MAPKRRAEVFTCPFCGIQKEVVEAIEVHVQKEHAEGAEGETTTDGASSTAQGTAEHETRQFLEDAEYALQLALAEQGLDPALAFTIANADASGSSATERERAVEEQSSDDDKAEDFVDCPCGERVPLADIEIHSSLHGDEDMDISVAGVPVELALAAGACNNMDSLHNISHVMPDYQPSKTCRTRELHSTPPRQKSRTSVVKSFFLGSPPGGRSSKTSPYRARKVRDLSQVKRLGRSELGPYAHEDQMPAWLQRLLEEGAQVTLSNRLGPHGVLVKVEAVANETAALIPVLARLSKLDKTVERAYYCSEDVRHVVKLPKEGGFCGYRNIQMLISYIRDAKAIGHEHFTRRVPSILDLQGRIEHAWDMGFNSNARIETGGIRLTRKYIGTPEAQALLNSLDIPCEAAAFSSKNGDVAYELLYEYIYEYFEQQDTSPQSGEVIITDRPPIYFQHKGHSMTIVGIEVRAGGEVNLVVFDPMYTPSPALKKLVDSSSFRCTDPAKLLKAHRRTETYLRKYHDFELLQLTGPLPGSVKEV